MKLPYLLLVCFLLSADLNAKNYYISGAGNDTNSGLSKSLPWKTLGRLNQSVNSLLPGDSVLFERGHSYYGKIQVTRNGTSVAPIVYTAYGLGKKPIINGADTLGNWRKCVTCSNSDIYEADYTSNDQIYELYTNNNRLIKARFPNEGKLLYIDSLDGNGDLGFYDNSLSQSSSYWEGATIRMKIQRWQWYNRQIASYSANKLNFTKPMGFWKCLPGWGYYFDNKFEELDQAKEWYHDTLSNRVFIIPEDITSLSKTFYTPKENQAAFIWRKEHLVIQDLAFKFYKQQGLNIIESDFIIVNGCSFENMSNNAINLGDVEKSEVSSCSFNHCVNNGIELFNTQHSVFRDNHIINSGMVNGYGKNGGQESRCGILMRGASNDNKILYNQIDTTGYIGIQLIGASRNEIAYNKIDYYGLVADDCGGIYCFGALGYTTIENEIHHNFISNGIGTGYGTYDSTSTFVFGIYLDQLTNKTNVHHNTVENDKNAFTFFHIASNNTYEDNVHYGSAGTLISNSNTQAKSGRKTRGNIVSRNAYYSSSFQVRDLDVYTENKSAFDSMATYSKNAFLTPDDEFGIWMDGNQSLEYAKQRYNSIKDDNVSERFAVPANLFTEIDSNLIANSTFDQNVSGYGSFSNNGSSNLTHHLNKLDSGTLHYTSDASSTSGYISTPLTSNNIKPNTKYRLRLSLFASELGSSFIRLKRQSEQVNNTEVRIFYTYNDERRKYDYTFTTSSFNIPEPAQLIIQHFSSGPIEIFLDNIVLEEVASIKNPSITELYQLHKNHTNSVATINLGAGSYFDAWGNPLCNSFQIPAWESMITVKVPDNNIYVGSEYEKKLNIIGNSCDVLFSDDFGKRIASLNAYGDSLGMVKTKVKFDENKSIRINDSIFRVAERSYEITSAQKNKKDLTLTLFITNGELQDLINNNDNVNSLKDIAIINTTVANTDTLALSSVKFTSPNEITIGSFENGVTLTFSSSNLGRFFIGNNYDPLVTTISKVSNFETIKVYPNPTSGLVNIESSEENLTLTLIDMMGKTVLEKHTDSSLFTWDLSRLYSGTYIMEFKNDIFLKRETLVITR